jgi:hypothetical protein
MMYTVWYRTYEQGNALIFVSDVPSDRLAERIAEALKDDMPKEVYETWIEED